MKKRLKFFSILLSFFIGGIIVYVSSNYSIQVYENHQQAKAFYSFLKSSGCFQNSTQWHSSSVRKNTSDWDLFFIPTGMKSSYYSQDPYKMVEVFQDVNGDGLPDYLFYGDTRHDHSRSNYEQFSCVMLNTGKGWDFAYKCAELHNTTVNPAIHTFYGDCAT